MFLNPVDALHGELGIVNSEDVAQLLSNSGETDELPAILPHLKRRGTARMALVGRVNSSLACGCNVVLDGSVDREVCPLNLAPPSQSRP
jgi:arabinose-5-phosphate isomerase